MRSAAHLVRRAAVRDADRGGSAPGRRGRRRGHRRRRQRHRRRARSRAARAARRALRAQRPRVRRERQLERNDPRRRALPAAGAAGHRDVVPRLGVHPAHRAAPALSHPVPDAAAKRRSGARDGRAHRRVLPGVRRLPAAEARQAALPPRRDRDRAPRARPRRLAMSAGVTFDEWGVDGARLCVYRRGRRHRARRPRPRPHDGRAVARCPDPTPLAAPATSSRRGTA